jgi:hypothetical protein
MLPIMLRATPQGLCSAMMLIRLGILSLFVAIADGHGLYEPRMGTYWIPCYQPDHRGPPGSTQ